MASTDLTEAFNEYAANSDSTKWSPGPASPLSKRLALEDASPPAGQVEPDSLDDADGDVRLLSYINGARGSEEGDLPASLTTDEALALPLASAVVVAAEPVRRLRRTTKVGLKGIAARDPDEGLEDPLASDLALAATATEKSPRRIKLRKRKFPPLPADIEETTLPSARSVKRRKKQDGKNTNDERPGTDEDALLVAEAELATRDDRADDYWVGPINALPKRARGCKRKRKSSTKREKRHKRENNGEATESMSSIPLCPTRPYCNRCKNPLTESDARVRVGNGKSIGSFRCGPCNTRNTQLYRRSGFKALTARFKKMNGNDVDAFWASVVGSNGTAEELDKIIAETYAKSSSITTRSYDLGDYQPLGYYKIKGYSVKKIRRNCKDTQQHPILGKTYRVTIHGGGQINDDVESRKQETASNPGGNATASGGQEARAANEKKAKADAQKAINKLRGIAGKLSAALKNKALAGMGDALEKPKETNDLIVEIMTDATTAVSSGVFKHSSDQVTKVFKQAEKHHALLNALVNLSR